MNNKVVLKIVLICLVVFLVFGALAAILAINMAPVEWEDNKFVLIGKGDPFEYHKDESFDLDGVTVIDIDTVSTEVVFYQSDKVLEVTLNCSGYAADKTVTLETQKVGNTINLEVKYPKGIWRNINITEGLLQIGIPKDYAETIKVNGVSSTVKTESHLENTFAKVDIDTVSGDINFGCTQIDDLWLNSTSGNLIVEETILGDINADSTSGNIEIRNVSSATGTITADTVSGRVAIYYDVLCETYIDTVSGDVSLYFPEDSVIDLEFNSVSGDLNGNYNKHSDGVYVLVDTVSGNLDIN